MKLPDNEQYRKVYRELETACPLPGQAPAETGLSSPDKSVISSRIWEIPALAYGPDIWSILRSSSNSESPELVNVEVYCKDGERLPIGPLFEIEPRQTVDVRIESPTSGVTFCWAKVTQQADHVSSELEVRAFVESLNGDELETFERRPAEAYQDAVRAATAREVEDKHLYFLNVADASTVLTLCAADNPKQDTCQKGAIFIFRILVKPRESIRLDVKKIKKKYLIIESSRPGPAISLLFSDEPGRRRFYSTESTISFGRSTK